MHTELDKTIVINQAALHIVAQSRSNIFAIIRAKSRILCSLQDSTTVCLVPVVLNVALLEVVPSESFRGTLLQVDLAEVFLLCLALEKVLLSWVEFTVTKQASHLPDKYARIV